MPLQIAPTLKRRTADKWLAALARYLYPGEVVWALASATAMYPPPRDGLAVTNARVLGFSGREVESVGPKIGVDADNIDRFDISPGPSQMLLIATRTHQQLSFGTLHDDDVVFVSHFVQHLIAAGFPPGMREAAIAHRAAAEARVADERHATDQRAEAARRERDERAAAKRRDAELRSNQRERRKELRQAEQEAAAEQRQRERDAAAEQRQAEKAAAAEQRQRERDAAAEQRQRERDATEADREMRERRRSQVEVFGPHVTGPAWRYLEEHSRPDEWPWFVIVSDTMGGVLAAFEDRLMIVKVGGYTSMMAGSFGGGRVTTFPYTDITNIEFNGGIVTGVLEVLTPSYQGTGQHDYWRSGHVSRNRAADSPFTLSNCLPIGKALYKKALPRINELQHKIVESKRPNIVVQQTPAQPSTASEDLAGQLQQLAELYSQGVLDAAEFAAAKQAAIKKHS